MCQPSQAASRLIFAEHNQPELRRHAPSRVVHFPSPKQYGT
ncbi:MAG: hypothetical protein KatS3mg114_0129 [Planctomycetaceae bacterium]|nr:MAG: hypothetical protein KatS3mg114_0129 [Planctomycetaceae bacterium]